MSEDMRDIIKALAAVELKILQLKSQEKSLGNKSTGSSESPRVSEAALVAERTKVLNELQKAKDALEREEGILATKKNQLAHAMKKMAPAIEREVAVQKKAVATAQAAFQSLEGRFIVIRDALSAAGKATEASEIAQRESSREAREEFSSIKEREAPLIAERDSLRAQIPPYVLKDFSRVFQRYPNDPLAEVDAERKCTRCGLTLNPQLFLKISTTKEFVRCAGCDRLVVGAVSEG